MRKLAMTYETLHLLKWRDKRDVHMCTTIHDASFVDVPGRLNCTTGEPIRRPASIIPYDKHMGAVDRRDEIITYPAFKRRMLKW